MLVHGNEKGVKPNGSFDATISADEELDAVRQLAALAREENDPLIEPALDLSDMDSLLSNAFASMKDDKTDTVTDDLGADMSDEALLDAALFDDEIDPDEASAPEATDASAAPTDAPHESLMDNLGESFVEGLKSGPKASVGADESLSLVGPNNAEGINATFASAQRQQGSDTLESIARAQAPGASGDQQSQRMEVGIIQGMSMLGGAGLAGLTQMLRAGGSTINNSINSRKYAKLSGEIESHTQSMDGILNKFGSNGFMAGVKGLKGEHKTEFVKEFMANPANKQMFDDLLQSIGTLSTKASQAAVAGAAVGLSGEQLDGEITNRIRNVSDKHKELLDSLHDHNGTKLSDRLNNLVDQVADFLKSMFSKVAEAFGYNQRPGM